jgi:hypothetical protein
MAGTDRHYTQGIRLSYFNSEDQFPLVGSNVVRLLPGWGFCESVARVGYSLGQSIYTPADVRSIVLVPGDRPYAGWLYAGMILQRRGPGWWNQPMLESLELDFGVVGPWSLGEQAQQFAHEVLGFGRAHGWDNQLHNEPGVLLKYARSVRLNTGRISCLESELIPQAGFSLGNINTSVRLGATARVGVRLPDDFGVQTIDDLQTSAGSVPTGGRPGWGGYLFASAEGRAVGYNEFLDGNVLYSSHQVSREPLVAEYRFGAVLVLHHLEMGYIHVVRSREFAGQNSLDAFGSIQVRVRF